MIALLTLSLVASAGRHGPPKPPKDAIALSVEDVSPTGDGHVVFLTDPQGDRIVPIHIGESEAIAIAFRLAGRKHDRPLTHDLLDDAVRGLGGEIVQVHIHTLQDSVFHARISIRQKKRTLHLDARASDAIALALNRGLPIYMSAEIFESTGVSMAELLEKLRQIDGP